MQKESIDWKVEPQYFDGRLTDGMFQQRRTGEVSRSRKSHGLAVAYSLCSTFLAVIFGTGASATGS